MSTEGRTARTTGRESLSDPAYQAFLALRTVFTVAPIVFGLDKFANLLTLSGFYDVALRDFGLLVAAVALARLATRYAPARHGSSSTTSSGTSSTR